jgi:hypothetical protein
MVAMDNVLNLGESARFVWVQVAKYRVAKNEPLVRTLVNANCDTPRGTPGV